MNYLSYIKNIFAFALVGCVTSGAILGFWIKGPELDLYRIMGAILFVLIGSVFFQDTLHEKLHIKSETPKEKIKIDKIYFLLYLIAI